MPTRRVAAYLAVCMGAGVIVGRAFGAFARAPFHCQARLQDVAPPIASEAPFTTSG
jgi:hypothetical protein